MFFYISSMLAYLIAPMLAYMPSLLAYITSMLTPQSSNFSPTSLIFSVPRPPGFDHYGQQPILSILVASSSGSSYVATSSEHSSQSQAHPRLFECDSRPLISTQSADNDRVESPIRDLDPIL